MVGVTKKELENLIVYNKNRIRSLCIQKNQVKKKLFDFDIQISNRQKAIDRIRKLIGEKNGSTKEE